MPTTLPGSVRPAHQDFRRLGFGRGFGERPGSAVTESEECAPPATRWARVRAAPEVADCRRVLRLPPQGLLEGVPRGGGEKEDWAVGLLGVADCDGTGDVEGDLDTLTVRLTVTGRPEAKLGHSFIPLAMLSMSRNESYGDRLVAQVRANKSV